MSVIVDIQTACRTDLKDQIPSADEIRQWVEAALAGRRDEAEVSVRLVDESEMAELNQRYRGKVGPTNVLSFPADLPPGVDHPLLGDIVICPEVVSREASQQHKTNSQHWSHMLVHGSLHLLGYDHEQAHEAEAMESIETSILTSLGHPCPYAHIEVTA